ncbi:bifunctional helix-turn-helix transcriptional regulator/GNAT family N-acetyltransferase [Aquabacterium sp. OR-4]|nr:bifunctional helix-turn-helix transcriptional regulator/GNAT family N-acetyltransferase [Aquabacterium sp. OR-4]MDT7833815.1 bifunctional helix-turn-helix transcriptional regulator/GNAT family N-acetyltransferase [Aquabacterium sp. OR-4]
MTWPEPPPPPDPATARAADAVDAPDAAAIAAVRRFNRFYTRHAGVLAPYLGSPLTLTEVRVLYELAHQPAPVASQLARALGLDGGYLSRILKRFEQAGWLQRASSTRDARQSLLSLTAAGQAVLAPLQQKSCDEAAALLAPLPVADRQAVVAAMGRIEALLQPAAAGNGRALTRTALLREPVPGDLGWVVQQHAELYAREHGFDSRFEGLVAGIVADHVRQFQPGFERCWMAELDGQRAGSVFVVRQSAHTAQLRLLLLRPEARGLGLGGRLTDACIAFARQAGYREMVLGTQRSLEAARAIYASRGFVCVASEPHSDYGTPQVAETWRLALA